MSWLHANGDEGVWTGTSYAFDLERPDPFPPLESDASADLCVVGGGITGLSAALHAARAGMSVIVLEAQRVGWGASGRNGGQIGTGFNWSQRRLEAKLGGEVANDLWSLAEEAKALTRALIAELAPEAGYVPGVISAALNARELDAMGLENDFMSARYGTSGEMMDRDAVDAALGTRAYAGGVLDRSAGHCDPLAYCFGLARGCVAAGVRICERSEVLVIDGTVVRTVAGQVSARAVLHATNGYSPGLTKGTAARVLPINNYVATTAKVPGRPKLRIWGNPALADSRFVVNYFRWTGDGRLVYGGGESYGRRFPSDICAKVRTNLARVYPDLADVELTHAWGGTLAVTATRLPWLAEVSPGVFAAGGYSGHGLALAGLFGKLVAEAARGERARFDLVGKLPVPALPGGRRLGGWMAQAGMWAGSVRDRLHYGREGT